MKRKVLEITVVFMMFNILPVVAESGIGIQGNINSHYASSSTYGLSITFKPGTVPWMFAANLDIDPLYVGFTADKWLANKELVGRLAYYYGWGVSAGVQLSDPVAVSPGFRAVSGLNMFFLDNALEAYFQAAWNPYVGFYVGSKSGVYPDTFAEALLNFPCAIGVRCWF